ncbi:MAG: hypothetical protein BWY83_03131 [bacterium ADurb.Bin478]|nr:MAG: hypothetical protein BWY83_03131 [bacterium ADurb.Bin478]
MYFFSLSVNFQKTSLSSLVISTAVPLGLRCFITDPVNCMLLSCRRASPLIIVLSVEVNAPMPIKPLLVIVVS